MTLLPYVCICFTLSLFSTWKFSSQYHDTKDILNRHFFQLYRLLLLQTRSFLRVRRGQRLRSLVTANKGDGGALIDLIVAQVLMIQNRFSEIELC